MATNNQSFITNLVFGSIPPTYNATYIGQILLQLQTFGTRIANQLNTGVFNLLSSSGTTALGAPSQPLNSTTGFLNIPICSGTPTGTPIQVAGYSPIIYDQTSNTLWVYNFNSSTWNAH